MINMFRRYSEDDMMQVFSTMLQPDEQIVAAVYCSYKKSRFHSSSNNLYPGYAALTDKDRFLGCKFKLLDAVRIVTELNDVTRLRVSGALFGQTDYYLRVGDDRKREIRFQVANKMRGAKFPNHTLYAGILCDALNIRQQTLF